MNMCVRILMALLVSACVSTADRSAAEPTTYFAPAGSIVLRIRVTNVEFTEYFPGSCEPGEPCVPYNFWHRYQADVREVLSGEWEDDVVHFANVQHTYYIDAVVRDCYVVLLPASEDVRAKVGVPYVVDTLLSPRFKEDRPIIRALRAGG